MELQEPERKKSLSQKIIGKTHIAHSLEESEIVFIRVKTQKQTLSR